MANVCKLHVATGCLWGGRSAGSITLRSTGHKSYSGLIEVFQPGRLSQMKKNFISVALITMLIALGATAASSQTVGARVKGTVQDNGKLAPGLQVVLTNEDTGRTFKAKTDKSGSFDVVGVPVGNNYKLEVFNPAGESLWKRAKIVINVNEGGEVAAFQIDVTDAGKTNLGMINEAGTKPSGGAGSTGPKYTKEQIEAMKAQNAKAQGQNALITQALTAIN